MENEFYTDDFEQLIKQKADQFRMYPSRRVWHSIYNNLHPSRRWPSFVMSILLLGSLTLAGYLHTGENSLTQKMNGTITQDQSDDIEATSNIITSKINHATSNENPVAKKEAASTYVIAFDDVITDVTDFDNYTVVRNNRPDNYFNSTKTAATEIESISPIKPETDRPGKDIVETMDRYIKSSQIFADLPVTPKKSKTTNYKNSAVTESEMDIAKTTPAITNTQTSIVKPEANLSPAKKVENNENPADKAVTVNPSIVTDKKQLSVEDKAWIENYALQNKPGKNKLKGRLSYQVYATPAVNYRKLSTNSKGSAAPFANLDINNNIKQTPGIGMELGAGLTYSLTKDMFVKLGVQFNYNNYNIDADQINHPIITTILLNDPNTGYSYSAARTSTTANSFNSTALSPITLHNRTYQISLPVGFAYKLSSHKNVDWFAGASVQPTYVFGGNAHLLSSDLKSYVSDPSTINSWNLNLGFETFMNFKLGSYSIQAGPQVRYQVYSTYRKNVALVEKPYAVGLKLGLTKGF